MDGELILCFFVIIVIVVGWYYLEFLILIGQSGGSSFSELGLILLHLLLVQHDLSGGQGGGLHEFEVGAEVKGILIYMNIWECT
jgi:hypothetical protein